MITTYVHFVQARYATEAATFGNQRIVTSAEYDKTHPKKDWLTELTEAGSK